MTNNQKRYLTKEQKIEATQTILDGAKGTKDEWATLSTLMLFCCNSNDTIDRAFNLILEVSMIARRLDEIRKEWAAKR